MRPGLIVGLLFLIVAFVAAAAETAVPAGFRNLGLVSAYDMLYALFPGKLIVFRIFVQQDLHPLLWDPTLLALLQLPAWVIAGIPGAVLFWKYRPHQGGPVEAEEDLPYSTYEDVVAAAEEAAHHEEMDPLLPKFSEHEDYDPSRLALLEPPEPDPEFWEPPAIDGSLPPELRRPPRTEDEDGS